MSDYIDRQSVIDAVNGMPDCPNGYSDTYDKRHIIAVLEDVPSVQPQRWIPVTEKLPEKPFGCLVTVMDTEPMTMEEFENILPYFVGYDGEQWNDWEGYQCPFEVLAWMPLPEPYKGGEHEAD